MISLAFFFLITTVPDTIVTIFAYELGATIWGNALLNLADTVDNSFHTLNFFVLLVTNKKFFDELRVIFCFKEREKGVEASRSLNRGTTALKTQPI